MATKLNLDSDHHDVIKILNEGKMASNNIFRVLIATDNHLGFAEKDPERANDSFQAFEEVLEIAVEQNVDFILLGGDLFHENKPSRQSLVRCMELLKKYTFGDRPVSFDFVSDPCDNFKHLKNPVVNYMDPNLNVSIPVFSIHGNHDDPAGLGQYCALDMISTAGLINYFGRTTDLKEINISPLLLEKGESKIALYGLSAVKDERLFRLFKENKVKMLRPEESTDSWFNIMVLHQNHTKHGMTNYIPEEFLDPFLHLVVWGHEHECLIEPRQSPAEFFVMQPGSSVATSLCAGEAKEKKVALLEVNNEQQFKTTPIKLKTIRPFVFDDVCLADHDLDYVMGNKQHSPVEEFVEGHINQMLQQAREQLTGHPRQPKKPLIRLRIEYSHDSQMFNVVRFGHKFTDEIANPNDMIIFKKQKTEKEKDQTGVDKDAMDNLFNADISEVRVEDLVEQYFADIEEQQHQLFLLTEKGLARAVNSFVEKDDKEAISSIFDHQVQKTQKHLMSQEDLKDEDDILEAIIAYRISRMTAGNPQEEEQETLAILNKPGRAKKNTSLNDDDDDQISDIDMDDEHSPPRPARGRGSRGGRARGSRGSRAAATSAATGRSARGSAANKTQLSMSSDGSPKTTSRTNTRRGGQGRGQTLTKTQSIMESFARAKSAARGGGRRGIVYDSDSDSD